MSIAENSQAALSKNFERLLDAVISGRIDDLRRVLPFSNPRASDARGMTPLMHAAVGGERSVHRGVVGQKQCECAVRQGPNRFGLRGLVGQRTLLGALAWAVRRQHCRPVGHDSFDDGCRTGARGLRAAPGRGQRRVENQCRGFNRRRACAAQGPNRHLVALTHFAGAGGVARCGSNARSFGRRRSAQRLTEALAKVLSRKSLWTMHAIGVIFITCLTLCVLRQQLLCRVTKSGSTTQRPCARRSARARTKTSAR
jgi:hypothetical protein